MSVRVKVKLQLVGGERRTVETENGTRLNELVQREFSGIAAGFKILNSTGQEVEASAAANPYDGETLTIVPAFKGN